MMLFEAGVQEEVKGEDRGGWQPEFAIVEEAKSVSIVNETKNISQ